MNIIRKPFKYSFWNATLILAAINIVVFIFTQFLGPSMGFDGFHKLPLKWYLGLSYYGLKFKYFWQPITYMFTHADIQHILFNMLALIVFGISVERAIGSKEFLCLYFFCGIFDGLISVLIYTLAGLKMTYLIGASGAVFSLLLTYAVIFPRNKIYIWGIIPIPAPLLVALYALIELGSQLFARGGNVAHLSHLAGFVLAWIYLRVRMGISPVKVWRDAYR